MSVPKSQKSSKTLAENADRFRFAGKLSDCLAEAENPLQVLQQMLSEVAVLLGAECCRLRYPTNDSWPAAARVNDRPPDLKAVISDGERPCATIEVTIGGEDPEANGSKAAFLDLLVRIASLAITKSKLQQRLSLEQTIVRDLDSAASLQRSMQPDYLPSQMPIWGLNLPAHQLSGDFFDFYRLRDDRIAFSLGDVSGKGVNAALLMAKTVSLFRYLGKRIESPAALLTTVNEELCETATRGMFVTMIAGHYRPRSGRVTFANAGHQPPLLRRPDRSYETFPATAPPLGILPSLTFTDEDVELAGGEFYVFTDGLTEYRYGDGELLGVEGLIQLIEAFAKESPARRLNLLLETLDAEEGWVARDDLTVLAIDDAWVRHAGIDETTTDTDRRGTRSLEAD